MTWLLEDAPKITGLVWDGTVNIETVTLEIFDTFETEVSAFYMPERISGILCYTAYTAYYVIPPGVRPSVC